MFENRGDAGRRLAVELRRRELHDPLVLGASRGGLVVAGALAEALGVEFDLVLSLKLHAPGEEHFPIGAVAEGGRPHLARWANARHGVPSEYVEREWARVADELTRWQRIYREIRPRATIEGRTVIVADDGVSTGATMIAALRAVRTQNPRDLIAVVPAATAMTLSDVQLWCDDVDCVECVEEFATFDDLYAHFEPVDDATAVRLLKAAGRSAVRPVSI